MNQQQQQQHVNQDTKTKTNPLLSVCYISSLLFVLVYYVLNRYYFETKSTNTILEWIIYSAFVFLTFFVLRNTNTKIKKTTDDVFYFFYTTCENSYAKMLDHAKKVLKIN